MGFVTLISACMEDREITINLKKASESRKGTLLDMVIVNQNFCNVLSSMQADMKSDKTKTFYCFKGSQEPLHISFCETIAFRVTPYSVHWL